MPLEGYKPEYLSIFSRAVLKLIQSGDPAWETMVPAGGGGDDQEGTALRVQAAEPVKAAKVHAYSDGRPTYGQLEREIIRLMAMKRPLGDELFDGIALAVHEFQRMHNAPYDAYCRALGGEVNGWRDIPAAPQSAFKRFAMRAFPETETVTTFRTSGTTGEGYGSHHFRSMRLYERSIVQGWRHFGLPTGVPQVFLIPRPEQAPYSSLSHMMGTLTELAPVGGEHFCVHDDGTLDVGLLERKLDAINGPVTLLGTALAFLRWFESPESQRRILPAGSQAMETGGYKGSGRALAKADLYVMFAERLGLSAASVINEYGMTELSSPFYSRGVGAPHAGPPWTRALVIDGETGAEAAIGEVGTVRLFDLANLGSSLAIQTQDLAVNLGDSRFELLGRDPAALPRGCSRAADEMMGAGAR